jgi:probable HAF family extracellular repeat protein
VAVLGKLSGGTYTQAAAINNTGEVAGSGDELTSLNGGVLAAVRSAIVWNGTIPTAIAHGEPDYVFNAASPSASAINNSGAAVGSFHNQTGAFFWSAGSLSTLPGKFQLAFANGISDTGQIVGNSTPFEAQPLSATFWASATSDPTELGVLAGFSGGTSVAYGINTAGKIVGNSSGNSSGKSVSRATLWLGTAVTDLGTLGGTSSGAAAINALGHIVGWADIGNNTAHAALWEPTTRAFDLGTLGGNGSYARGINVEGDVVGSAQTRFGVWHAVLWTHKHFTAVDLNAEISIAESQAITLTEAVGTNGKCAIVANGYDNKTKTAASFVLSLANQANCNQQ